MHENDDEISAIRQHLSQTPTEGAGALPGKDALAGSLAGKDALAGAGALADEGAMSATSIHEDEDELSLIKQHLSQTPTEGADALADEGASSVTSLHEDEIRRHLSYAPRTSILPVLSKTAVS